MRRILWWNRNISRIFLVYLLKKYLLNHNFWKKNSKNYIHKLVLKYGRSLESKLTWLLFSDSEVDSFKSILNQMKIPKKSKPGGNPIKEI